MENKKEIKKQKKDRTKKSNKRKILNKSNIKEKGKKVPSSPTMLGMADICCLETNLYSALKIFGSASCERL